MKFPMAADVAAPLERVPPCLEAARVLVGCLEELKLRGLAELAAGAAHEINNPLAIISGQAQHLLKSEESPDRIHALQRIVSQSQRIHGILNDLMLYARPPRPHRRSVALPPLVASAALELADLALERRVRLELVETRHRVRLHADPHLLQTAIHCLLRNGVEAAPAEGWVRVVIETTRDQARIVVEDNGPGLNPAQREHLFDPFYSGRSAGRGVGLGLSKAWRIAQLHGGELDFDSQIGKPTRFVLVLPLELAAPEQKPAPGRRLARKPVVRSQPGRNGKHPLRRRA